MKKIIIALIFMNYCAQASAYVVITLYNRTGVNLHAQLYFSDNTMQQKDIGIAQSYQIVNFDSKALKSINFTSQDKDKNGNFFAPLDQNIAIPKENVAYNVMLEKVPAHQVPATAGVESFMMPETQKIVSKKVEHNH